MLYDFCISGNYDDQHIIVHALSRDEAHAKAVAAWNKEYGHSITDLKELEQGLHDPDVIEAADADGAIFIHVYD